MFGFGLPIYPSRAGARIPTAPVVMGVAAVSGIEVYHRTRVSGGQMMHALFRECPAQGHMAVPHCPLVVR